MLGICTKTQYLLCDETFDGLDPVVTEAMKNLFGKEIQERALTVVVAAHKLQDLEDFCNEIGILHKGGLLLAGDMREKAGTMTKIQCVFEQDEPLMAEHPSIVRCHRGRLLYYGDRQRKERGGPGEYPAEESHLLQGGADDAGRDIYDRDGGKWL